MPSPVELFPQRTTHEHKEYLMNHLNYTDPYDTELYEKASIIFEEQIAYAKQRRGIVI